MVKELIFRLNSKSQLESLLDRLDERIILEKKIPAGEMGYTLNNDTRTLELQVLPLSGGDIFEINVYSKEEEIEKIIKDIFGHPIREHTKDASFLDVAEYIASLSLSSSIEIKKMVIEKFVLAETKFEYFRKMILKQAKKKNAREEFISAAKLLA